MIQQPRLYTLEMILAANARQQLPVQAEFLYVQEATGAVFIYLDGENNKARLEKGLKYRAPAGQTFLKFDIEDASGAQNTVRLAFGYGDYDDKRLALPSSSAIALAGNAGIATAADVVIGAAALTAIVAANSNRRAIALKNVGANVIRVGDSVNTAVGRGHELQAGETIVLTTTAAVSGFSTAGTTISILEETA